MSVRGYIICTSETPLDEQSWVGGAEWIGIKGCLAQARKTPLPLTWALERDDRVRLAQGVVNLKDELAMMRATLGIYEPVSLEELSVIEAEYHEARFDDDSEPYDYTEGDIGQDGDL